MKPITKKIIITGQLITLALYIIIYLIGTFCLWEFKNPFKWIIDMPTYSGDSRFGILVGFFMYYAFLYCMVAGHYFQKEKAEREKAEEVEQLDHGNIREFVLFLQLRGLKFANGKWTSSITSNEMNSHELIEFYKKHNEPFLK